MSFLAKWREKLEKIAIICVFCLTACYLFAQFHNVVVYFDDYGYYSLTYAGYVHTGNTFTINELFSFLQHHYNYANGRLLYFFIWLMIYHFGGLTFVQVSAAIIVLSVLFLVWRVILQFSDYSPVKSAILTCLFYGLIDVTLHRNGTYWFVAFFIYITPIIPLLLFHLLYFKDENKLHEKNGTKVVLCVLAFCSAFSQEQWACITVFYTVCLCIYRKWNHKRIGNNVAYVICAAIGLLILFLSPGLTSRASQYADGYDLISQILYGFDNVIHMFFSTNSKYSLFVLWVGIGFVCIWLFQRDERHNWKIFDLIEAIGSFIISVLYLFAGKIGFEIPELVTDTHIIYVCYGILVVFLISLQMIRFYLKKNNVPNLILFITSLVSIGCLIFLPETPLRLLLGPWFLMFIMMANNLLLLREILSVPYIMVADLPIIAVIMVLSINNSLKIYDGYKTNAEVYWENDSVFCETKEELDQGNDVDTIYLKKIDILYGGEMVYYEGFEFMKPWIDSYYELPDTISYVYTDTGDPIGNNLETCNVINGYWSDGWVSSNAEIEIATGDEGLLHIEGWIPDSEELNVITEKWIIITCNGEVSECEIKENSYSIFSIDVQTEKNEIINVVIETNFAFCPGGEDTREVSFVLNVLEGE